MQFRISFEELQGMITSKTGKNVPLLYGGPHTVRISYDVNVLFKSSSVGIDITVDRIDGSDLHLSHTGGFAIEMALKMALGRIKEQPVADMVELSDGSRAVFHLGRNPQLAQVFDKVIVRDICFDEKYVIIDFVPKLSL